MLPVLRLIFYQQMAPLVLEDSLLHFLSINFFIRFPKRDLFHLGWVLPSHDLFTYDGASLVELFIKNVNEYNNNSFT